jgi:DNA-binding FadR family transcriptional regulator
MKVNISIIKSQSAKEQLVSQVEAAIISEQVHIGDQLPTEREMAEQMGISKTVVHAGMAELEKQGFIFADSRKGLFVGDYIKNGNIDTLTSILRYSGRTLNHSLVLSIINLRLYVETPAIRLASEHMNEEAKKHLKHIIDDFKKAMNKESQKDMAIALFCFTREVCIISNDIISPIVFNAFKDISLQFWESGLKYRGSEYTLNFLLSYYDYLSKGEADKACALLKDELTGESSVYQRIKEDPDFKL